MPIDMQGTGTTNDAVLVLADGRRFPGRSFGAPACPPEKLIEALNSGGADDSLVNLGELVFNTAMSGYPEVLTDPSYTGQIVAMTYPHIGNYGVDGEWSERGPGGAGRSLISVAGLVVREVYRGPVPFGRQTLHDHLAEHGVPGISGVDTRAVTLHLRTQGSQNAAICGAGDTQTIDRVVAALSSFPSMEGRGLIDRVGTATAVSAGGSAAGPHVVLYDCGAKANIVRELEKRGCRLSVLPATASAEEIRATGADAVFLSNGPGDPAVLAYQVEQTRQLLGTLPVLGICLGHQIIAEAAGGRTGKMKFGHHGMNHPVRDERSRRVFVTSQNHGFTVDEESLPAGLEVWFRNANDGTVEGLRDDERRICCTQFHPESAPGPVDATWIFDEFLSIAGGTGDRQPPQSPSASISPRKPRKDQ